MKMMKCTSSKITEGVLAHCTYDINNHQQNSGVLINRLVNY